MINWQHPLLYSTNCIFCCCELCVSLPWSSLKGRPVSVIYVCNHPYREGHFHTISYVWVSGEGFIDVIPPCWQVAIVSTFVPWEVYVFKNSEDIAALQFHDQPDITASSAMPFSPVPDLTHRKAIRWSTEIQFPPDFYTNLKDWNI